MTAFASTPKPRASLLAAIAPAVILSWGWRRRFIALVAGALGALAMPPFGFLPALAVSMIVAVWLIDGAAHANERVGTSVSTLWTAFAAGWWWGFGYFVASLWWLGVAFLVDAAHFAWALPFGVLGLPAVLAIFPGLGFALARGVWPPGAARALALAFGLGLSEWLRAVVLTGFPWNEFGLALGEHLTLAQGAAYVGEHGLTLAAIALGAAPATLWESRGWRRFAPTVATLAALGALAGFGQYRLAGSAPAPAPGVKLRILQTRLTQGADFSPENGGKIVSGYLQLSDRPSPAAPNGMADVTHLIWPESAFPFILAHEPGALARLTEFLRGGAILAVGAARADTPASGQRPHYYNSILTVNLTGLLPARYDKRHLVPFGEYLPLQSWFDRIGVSQFVRVPGGFTPGRGSELLAMPGAPDALASVCYEAIFPSEWGGVRDGADARAGWIVNVTDDGWFGMTPGPYQHFAQARLRAIEWGLPLARAANGGVSAIVDAYGRIVASADLGSEGVIDGALPGALPPTPESHWGSAFFAAGLASALAISLAARARG